MLRRLPSPCRCATGMPTIRRPLARPVGHRGRAAVRPTILSVPSAPDGWRRPCLAQSRWRRWRPTSSLASASRRSALSSCCGRLQHRLVLAGAPGLDLIPDLLLVGRRSCGRARPASTCTRSRLLRCARHRARPGLSPAPTFALKAAALTPACVDHALQLDYDKMRARAGDRRSCRRRYRRDFAYQKTCSPRSGSCRWSRAHVAQSAWSATAGMRCAFALLLRRAPRIRCLAPVVISGPRAVHCAEEPTRPASPRGRTP